MLAYSLPDEPRAADLQQRREGEQGDGAGDEQGGRLREDEYGTAVCASAAAERARRRNGPAACGRPRACLRGRGDPAEAPPRQRGTSSGQFTPARS
ncbi:hypothetical protein [Streptomyces marispadix]|uniref:Uncharacterized protein n=1 Tax=Streptomyces marispadix TaxID=2922868 RepID=A0ABS9T043_9ACTN|nr:hypothetical protein [Streptomyces marispadix]MCH6161899.1 hypothetical protein [Streptomyces marispadix]